MKNMPVYEVYSALVNASLVIAMAGFNLFEKQEPLYRLMASVMPYLTWSGICFLAFGLQLYGLLRERRWARYIGLVLSGSIHFCLFIINLMNYPNLLTGFTLMLTIFCFISLFYVRHTDLITRHRRERWETEHPEEDE